MLFHIIHFLLNPGVFEGGSGQPTMIRIKIKNKTSVTRSTMRIRVCESHQMAESAFIQVPIIQPNDCCIVEVPHEWKIWDIRETTLPTLTGKYHWTLSDVDEKTELFMYTHSRWGCSPLKKLTLLSGSTEYDPLKTYEPVELKAGFGDRVKAKVSGWTRHFSGEINRVNSDGTYDITFDDGEKKRGVTESQIEGGDEDKDQEKDRDEQ